MARGFALAPEQGANVLIACFPTQQDSDAKAAVISTIKRIYKKASTKIHTHIDSNNVAIVVHLRDFPRDNELDVLRALAKFHKFKLVEAKWFSLRQSDCGAAAATLRSETDIV